MIERVEKLAHNYAFIDSQNLYLSIHSLVWKLDMKRFRVFLKEKYAVEKAYLFIGFIETNQSLYKSLQESGYILIFKPTLKYKDGTTKGNCDSELVLQAMIDYDSYERAVIVSGDGDFYCLIDYLKKNNKLEQVLIPNKASYSALLKRINESETKYFSFISDMKNKLAYSRVNEKGPIRTKP
jgi:uncharacterized LabA/DUF88 family protein